VTSAAWHRWLTVLRKARKTAANVSASRKGARPWGGAKIWAGATHQRQPLAGGGGKRNGGIVTRLSAGDGVALAAAA